MSKPSHKPESVRWPLLRSAVIYAFAMFALATPWLLGNLTIPWDAKAHFYPQFVFMAQSFAAGDTPTWNPFTFGGHPQIADPQSLIFSPPHLIVALFNGQPSLLVADAIVFAMLFAGGLAIIFYARDRNWHPAGALVAALAFSMGGSAAWRLQHVGQILSLSWFAIAFFLLARTRERGSWGWGIAAGVATGFMLAGRDQVAYLGAWILFAYALTGLAGRGWRSLIVPFAAAAGTALLVAALPILLSLSLAGLSNRSAIDLLGAERGSLHPASLFTLVVGNLFGVTGPLSEFWGPPSPAWGPTDLFLARNMGALYVGLLPLAGIFFLAFRRALFAPEARFFTAALIVLMIYALGRYTPLFALFHGFLPGVNLFRRPADATFLIGFMTAMLGGYGVHGIIVDGWRWNRDGLLIFGGLTLLLVGAAGLAMVKEQLPKAMPALIVAGASLVLLAATFAVLALVRRRPVLVTGLMTLALALDLALTNAPNESTALPRALYAMLDANNRTDTLKFLKDRLSDNQDPDRRDRVELVGLGFDWPNAAMIHKIETTLGYNPLRLGYYAQATGAQDHAALADQKGRAPLLPSYKAPLADLLGLRYIVTAAPLAKLDPQAREADFPVIARIGEHTIYSNPRALPRVMVIPQAQAADQNALIATGRWGQGFDPTRTVLLAPEDVKRLDRGGDGVARIVRYENGRVVVAADSPRGGVLVLNDVYHPWWRATIDGTPVTIMRANGIFRAVALPAGKHEVVFEFAPLRGLGRDLVKKIF